ncbi:MAG: hypothetical protein A3F73_01905 [Gallionellales bacterium RIFCSPLOWO2_12_FULL_59_22]|nr:MAG: hypothetical protein A3H99_05905 [Gallionellales bacterium RIFCSPLOWO2_02_FULL_59_110]OGT04798.1 MAG: hypothetical protein A2Z65_08925 [Gallionellales bacterium RIFCSPLOWO2_02_58_13]OGT13876.1 MAG: hypothetical protein A3F73_01905 [Gallionellales bacterium RIFCSPLOWO2_12_FULL_59_22]
MKLNKFALTLTAAALLPTFAFAGTDEVAASFERDMVRGAVFVKIDEIAASFDRDIVLRGAPAEADPIVASFERDMHREPTVNTVMIAGEPDPLAAIHAALWRGIGDTLVVRAAVADSHRHDS